MLVDVPPGALILPLAVTATGLVRRFIPTPAPAANRAVSPLHRTQGLQRPDAALVNRIHHGLPSLQLPIDGTAGTTESGALRCHINSIGGFSAPVGAF